MKKPFLPIALSLGILATSATSAEKEEPAKPDRFATADKNGDEKLSSTEFTNMMLGDFEAMDTDRSRDLTGDELGPEPSPIVIAMDTNKDAKITRAEFTTAVRNLFKDLDTDEDKGVTKGELAVLEAATKGSGAKKSAPPATGN